MRVTQADIARLASVSQATVSRVLAGDERVEGMIRDRVLRVMREKNYRPDVRARSLRMQTTGLIGLVLKRPSGGLGSDPFFAALTSGIVDSLSGRPFHLCMDVVTDEAAQEHVYDEMLRTRRVDGLILVEPTEQDDRIHLLQRDRFPFVTIGNPKNPEIASVDNDNVHAGEIAARHLFERGYRRVGFLAGPEGVTVSDDRINGYSRVCEEYNQRPLVWHSNFGFEAARETTDTILNGDNAPDALIVLDDFMAFGTLLSARTKFISVPDDLGLVSFNDSILCRLAEGGLTSINLNLDLMVNRAVAKLLEIVERGEASEPVRELVPCALTIRGSSSPMRGVVVR